MNLFEKIISAISPQWAFRRNQYRSAMAAYEASKKSRLRKAKPDNSSGDSLTQVSGDALRGYARTLEQNYDLASGVLDVLINNTVGPNGVSMEPMPRNKDGSINVDVKNQLIKLHKQWSKKPDVTGEHNWANIERLSCRSWFRDGEILIQKLLGSISGLKHSSIVPFSIELIESDHLPIDYTDNSKLITQGVERNAWGKPVAYHLYKKHPGDCDYFFEIETKRVPADKILHPKQVKRVRQARGVTIFASVMIRLEDIKDYEESERVAARISAALAAYIKKGTPDLYQAPEDPNTERHFAIKPGIVFDNLQEGEEVGTIQSNRPSTLLEPFRNAMLKAVSSGTGANYSTMSKDYDGSYSSQRQELVEGWTNYRALTNLFIGQVSQPVWEAFVEAAIASKVLVLPAELDIETIKDADYRGPVMPWIDPDKEIKAKERSAQATFKSPPQIIRENGDNPDDVLDQLADWKQKLDDRGLTSSVFETPEAPDNTGASSLDEEENEDAKTVSD